MLDCLLDALFDSLKLLVFMYLAYLLIEFLEHKASAKMTAALTRLGRFGSVPGALLGCVPQCGFSVAASNLYAGKIITYGTLIAVFISSSDEALPVLALYPEKYGAILPLLVIKVVTAVAVGMLIDFVFLRKAETVSDEHDGHEHVHEHCGDDCCKHGIWLAALKHTAIVFAFVLVMMIIFNILVFYLGEESIAAFIGTGKWYSPLLAALVGFIPNCASSVIITELYAKDLLSFGALVAGLTTNTGVALLTLIRFKHCRKTALITAAILLFIGVALGLAFQFIGIKFKC